MKLKIRPGRKTMLLFLVATTVLVSAWACVCASPGISQADATERALRYTGLGDQPQIRISAEPGIVPADDNVPFLQLAGRSVWRVVMKDVRILIRDADGVAHVNPSIRELEVLLDHTDGRLLKITSPSPPDQDPARKQPASGEREESVASRLERYEGVAPELPQVTFVAALQSTQDQGIGGATQAKQIEALYVLVRRTAGPEENLPEAQDVEMPCWRNPCQRWIITFRYLPPVLPPPPSGAGPIALPPFVHVQNEVDAITGEWVRAGSTP